VAFIGLLAWRLPWLGVNPYSGGTALGLHQLSRKKSVDEQANQHNYRQP
jgi:hypothetical protein